MAALDKSSFQFWRQRLLHLAVIFPAVCLASIAAAIFQDYRTTLDAAESDAGRISAALGEHANRAIGEADRLMLNVVAEIERQEALMSPRAELALHRLLKPYSNSLPQLLSIIAVDHTGQVMASGLTVPNSGMSVSDREYFRYHSIRGNTGLYISRAVKSRVSGQWIFTISRAIAHRDGSLKMILVAGISLAYFESFYRSLNLSENSRLLLVRRDGWVLMESPLSEKALDTNIANAALFEHFRKSASGTYRLDSGVVDGTPRIVGYTDSSTYPFLAVASLSRHDVLSPWNKRVQHSLAWGLIAATLILLLIIMLRRRFNDLLTIHADLEEKNKVLAMSERRYEGLVNGVDGIVWEADFPSLQFTYVSRKAEMITGYPVNDWLDNPRFWEEGLNTSPQQVLDTIPLSKSPYARGLAPLEHHVASREGQDIWLLNTLTITDIDGEMTLRGVMVDNTEKKRAFEELELAAQVFANSLLGILIVGQDGTILRANKAYSDLMGYSEDELIGASTSSIETECNHLTLARTIEASLQDTGKWQGEVRARTKSGNELILLKSMSLARDEDGNPRETIIICKDITAQRNFEKRLYQMAHFDHLTNLPNRQTLTDRIEHAVEIATEKNSKLAVLFLDLDQFKTINDTLGHAIGDQVLCSVADRISNCLRISDTVARVGGDEFIVLLEDTDTEPDLIQRISCKLCDSISEPILLNGMELFVGLSMGISLFPQDGHDSGTLIRNADTAMYRAKIAGRNCWRYFDESMARHEAYRLELRMALRHAVDRREMRLYYQPQGSLHTGEVIGVEALIRWNRPTSGVISPLDFIPISEESNLIIPIGNWVIRTACEQAMAWLMQQNLRLRVGVNITAKQIHHEGFVDHIYSTLQQTGLPPELLELEITESSVLENIEEAVVKLGQLKALGVTVAIDDFGTGYSSLSYLTQLPIDRLKIDQSFVRNTPTMSGHCTIIRTIIAMSNNLGLSVIAEGVESKEQFQFLRAEGCDEIQGYLLSPPKPADALAELLNGRRLAQSMLH